MTGPSGPGGDGPGGDGPGGDSGTGPGRLDSAPMSWTRRLDIYAAQNGQSHHLTHRQNRRANKKLRRALAIERSR